MEDDSLDTEQSEDLMRPPRALRSKRKRGGSAGEADKGNLPKKFCNEDALLKLSSDVVSLAEKSFIDDLKKESDFSDCGDLKTSTPNGAENLPQKKRKRGLSTTGADTTVSVCLSQLDVSYAMEKSQTEETSGNDKSLELSGIADDCKPLERSGRRNKCTSARVLLGLEKRKSKEMTGQPKDVKEKSIEMMSVDRKPKLTGPKVKKEVLPKVQHEILSTTLEGFPETPTSLFVERCGVVKPDWLKPFKLGWRREIVFRNTVKTPSSSKPLCDVYYFSSDDTKLRSLPQIIDYLKTVKSTLTGECFTFTKSAIYKEPQEMVRAAAFSRGRLSRPTGLLSSSESSMKSFDEANDDALSQASSTGTNRQRKVRQTIASQDSCKADVSVKTEAPVIQVVAETPVIPVVVDIKKEEVSPNAGGMTSVDETDKRQAVRAAATMALRTYMSHALRTVNNPLLQSGNVKPPDKDKTVSSKPPVKTKSAPLQGKHQLSRRSLSPVVNIKRLSLSKTSDACNSGGRPEENVRRRKGPPSAMNLAKLNAKRSDESYSTSKSREPMTSKATKLKARTHLSTAATPKPGLAEKSSFRDLKKMSPLKKSIPKLPVSAGSPSVVSNSFEKINAAIKALMSKKDGQPSPKKLSKSSNQQVAPLPAKPPSKSKAPTTLPSPVVRILPKPDGKSNEKPTLSTERKPSVTPTFVGPKQVESSLIETSRICGMDCPGRLGIPPTLPCATCMCLFHPECAGYTSHMYFTPQLNFTCWVCGKLNKELENTSYGLFKSENPTSETSSSEVATRNPKKPSAVDKSTSNGGNLVDDTNAVALSSPRVQQPSNHGAFDAAMVLDQPNILHHSFSLSGMSVEEVTVSCGPSAQLLVIPAALARHLNLSNPLTLLVDDKEVQVKPEQLKVSGVGLNITLPPGSVPDAFVEGPEIPLEFRVVSTSESGHQAVAVSLFERPLKLSSALESFSTRRTDPTALPLSDSVGKSDSKITGSNDSDIMAFDPVTGVIKRDRGEGNLESSCSQTTGLTKSDDGFMISGVASNVCEGVAAECKTVAGNENMDVEEDLDLGKSERKAGISSEVNKGQFSETEHKSTVCEKELSIAKVAMESPTEASLSSSLKTGNEVMEETLKEEPRTGVSMETESLFPITGSTVDDIHKTKASGEHSEGIDHDSYEEKTTNSSTPFACSTTDESKESLKEREIAAVIGNFSATSCAESQEGVGTVTLKGNLLVSTEMKDEIKSSRDIDAMSSTDVIAVEETNASIGSML